VPVNDNTLASIPGIENLTYEDATILLNMQKIWLSYVEWIRNFLHSVLENYPNQTAVINQLYQGVRTEFYNELLKYFSKDETWELLRFITEFMEGNWNLLNSYKNKDETAIGINLTEWYKVADAMASYFSRINSFYDEVYLKTLFYNYIGLKNEEIKALSNDNYDLEIEIYNQIKDIAEQVGNYIALGIIDIRHKQQIAT